MSKLKIDNFKFQLTEEQKSKLITEDSGASDEQKDTICALFESAVNKTISAQIEKANDLLEETIENRVQEETAKLKADYKEYLKYVVDEWVTENKEALQQSIQSKLNAKCIEEMKKAFTENYVSISEDRIDVLKDVQKEIELSEAKADELFDENVKLKNKLFEVEKQEVIKNLTSELAETQIEKIEVTLEHVSADNIEDFTTKAKLIVKATTNESVVEKDLDTKIVEESSKDTNGDKGAGGNKKSKSPFLVMAGL